MDWRGKNKAQRLKYMRCQNLVYWLIQCQSSNGASSFYRIGSTWLQNVFSSSHIPPEATAEAGVECGAKAGLRRVCLLTWGPVCLAQEEDSGEKEDGPPGEEERSWLSRGLYNGP